MSAAAANEGRVDSPNAEARLSPEPASSEPDLADFNSTMKHLSKDMHKLKSDVVEFQASMDRQQKELKDTSDQLSKTIAEGGEDAERSELEVLELNNHTGSWRHAVLTDWRELAVAPRQVRSNRDLVLQAVCQDYRALQAAIVELRDDRHFVIQAVKIQGLSLQFASERLRDDREVVEHAIGQDRLALRYASEVLRADPDLIRQAMSAGEPWTRGGQAVHNEHQVLRTDEAAVRMAVDVMDPARWKTKVQRDWQKLEMAPPSIKADREIVEEAIRSSWAEALQYAAPQLRKDKDLVLDSVKMDGRVLQFADDELRGDSEVVLAAVRQTWHALAYATQEQQSVPEIVRAAMLQSPDALAYASTELCANRDFILEAVEMDGQALKYASAALQADRAVVLKAVRQTWEAFRFANPDLRQDREICCVASKPSICFDTTEWHPEKDRQLVRQEQRRSNLCQEPVPPRGLPIWPGEANARAIEEYLNDAPKTKRERPQMMLGIAATAPGAQQKTFDTSPKNRGAQPAGS